MDEPHGSPGDEHPFGNAEPARDASLGSLLREVVGEVPEHRVNWSALASRIATATARTAVAPWWSHAAQWERRVLPLALAAGLAGLIALWNLGEPTAMVASASTSSDPVSAIVIGDAASDVAARFVTAVATSGELAAGELY